MSRMSTSGWPVGTGTADAAGRVPPWSVADPGPGDRSGWPELEELEKDNPQEPRPGGRRANPPAPGRWAPGGHQRPRNSHGLPESRSRESRLRPEGRLT